LAVAAAAAAALSPFSFFDALLLAFVDFSGFSATELSWAAARGSDDGIISGAGGAAAAAAEPEPEPAPGAGTGGGGAACSAELTALAWADFVAPRLVSRGFTGGAVAVGTGAASRRCAACRTRLLSQLRGGPDAAAAAASEAAVVVVVALPCASRRGRPSSTALTTSSMAAKTSERAAAAAAAAALAPPLVPLLLLLLLVARPEPLLSCCVGLWPRRHTPLLLEPSAAGALLRLLRLLLLLTLPVLCALPLRRLRSPSPAPLLLLLLSPLAFRGVALSLFPLLLSPRDAPLRSARPRTAVCHSPAPLSVVAESAPPPSLPPAVEASAASEATASAPPLLP